MKYFVFILSCNEIQVKVNLEITTFFFLFAFSILVPTFSDLGLYITLLRMVAFYCIMDIIFTSTMEESVCGLKRAFVPINVTLYKSDQFLWFLNKVILFHTTKQMYKVDKCT